MPKKNKGGRPPLTPGERVVQMMVSMSHDEYRLFMASKELFGHKSKSSFFRQMFQEFLERNGFSKRVG